MERKISQVIDFLAIGPDNNLFYRHRFVVDNPIAIAEPAGRVEVGRALEALVREFEGNDAVKRHSEDTPVQLGELDKCVPAAVEQANKQRVQGHRRLRHFASITTVSRLNANSHLHGLDEPVQELALGRDGLQDDAVVHALALREFKVHGHRGQHPVLDGTLLQDLLVVDVVPEAVLLVALDDDPEHVQDGVAMAVEGRPGDGHALAHVRPHPKVVDFLEGQFPAAMDDVHQPDVLFVEVVGFHRGSIVYGQGHTS